MSGWDLLVTLGWSGAVPSADGNFLHRACDTEQLSRRTVSCGRIRLLKVTAEVEFWVIRYSLARSSIAGADWLRGFRVTGQYPWVSVHRLAGFGSPHELKGTPDGLGSLVL